VEAVSAKLLGLGYGMTFGALYGVATVAGYCWLQERTES